MPQGKTMQVQAGFGDHDARDNRKHEICSKQEQQLLSKSHSSPITKSGWIELTS